MAAPAIRAARRETFGIGLMSSWSTRIEDRAAVSGPGRGAAGGPAKAGIMPNKPPWHKEKSREVTALKATPGAPSSQVDFAAPWHLSVAGNSTVSTLSEVFMFAALAKRLFGSANDRFIKGLREVGPGHQRAGARAREALRRRAAAPHARAARAPGQGRDPRRPPAGAFATVREAAKRTLGQRHFDVQLIGGMVLHQGKIAEMKTGEGKTLVATLPVYLNALDRQGRARRHGQRLSRQARRRMDGPDLPLPRPHASACIVHGLDDDERRAAYACDVTYGTNNEFGFDYLRDNMKFRLEEMVQRGHSTSRSSTRSTRS